MKNGLVWGLPLFLFLLSTAEAQDMVEAFRGDEVNDRNFSFEKKNRFQQILSFWYEPDSLKPWAEARRGYRGTIGSLTGKELFVHQEMKFRPDNLASNLSFLFHFLQEEDFDSRYTRFTFEPELYLNDHWELFAPLEATPEKDGMDLGAGIRYRSDTVDYLQATYIRSNALFNEVTDTTNEFEQNPGTLDLQGSLDVADHIWLQVQVGQVFPLVWDRVEESSEFRFERFYYRSAMRIQCDPELSFYFTAAGELTKKENDFATALNVNDVRLNRKSHHITGEVRARAHGVWEYRAGLGYFYLRESDKRPGQFSSSEFIRRREASVWVGWEYDLNNQGGIFENERYAFFNNWYLTVLNNDRIIVADPSQGSRENAHPIAKTDFGFRIQFSPNARVIIGPGIKFFGPNIYGGTNIQVNILF